MLPLSELNDRHLMSDAFDVLMEFSTASCVVLCGIWNIRDVSSENCNYVSARGRRGDRSSVLSLDKFARRYSLGAET